MGMPLAHAIVTSPSLPEGTSPPRLMLFLHGILGSGANWRTFAKQVVTAQPDWGAVLVDLRLHGDSREIVAPPHTISAAAGDVQELVGMLEASSSSRVRGVLGHSFGGKIALD